MFLSGLDQTRHTIFLGSKASCSAPLWSYASYVCEAAINNLPKKQRCDRLPSLPNSIKQSSPNPTNCVISLFSKEKNGQNRFPASHVSTFGFWIGPWALRSHRGPGGGIHGRGQRQNRMMKNDVMWFCMIFSIFSCSWIVWTSVFSLCLGSFGNDGKAQKDARLKSVDFLLYVFHIYIYTEYSCINTYALTRGWAKHKLKLPHETSKGEGAAAEASQTMLQLGCNFIQ